MQSRRKQYKVAGGDPKQAPVGRRQQLYRILCLRSVKGFRAVVTKRRTRSRWKTYDGAVRAAHGAGDLTLADLAIIGSTWGWTPYIVDQCKNLIARGA